MYNCYKILLLALMVWYLPANSQTAVAYKNGRPAWYKVHPRVMMSPAKIQAIKKGRSTSAVLDTLCRYALKEADHILTLTPPPYKKTTDEEQLWQREVGTAMSILAMAEVLTGERKYLDAAVTWANMATTYPSWGWGGTDLGAGHLLFGMASVYDWCYDRLDPTFRQQLEQEMLTRGRIMYRSLQPGGSWMRDVYLQNHLWVTNGGIFAAAVSLIDKYPEVQPWIDSVRAKHRRTFDLLGPDGASHEGVAYWTYGIEYLLRYMEMARDLYGEDNYTSEWFKKTARYYLGLALPKSAWPLKQEIVDIGDCPRKSYYGPNHILRKLAAEYGDGYAQQRARELDNSFKRHPGSEWQGVLWYDDKVKGKHIDDYPTLSFYEDMGIIGSRSSWKGDESLLVFKCAPPMGHSILKHHSSFGSAGHVHPDAASFSLFGSGRFLIRNPGYAMKRTHYQNTLTVNGKGQKGESRWFRYAPTAATEERERKITMRVVSHSNDMDYFIGDAAAAYEAEAGVTVFKRHMVFLKQLSTLVIVDEIELDKAGTATLHFHPEVAAKRLDEHTLVSGDSLATLYFKALTPGVAIDNMQADTLIATGGKPFFLPVIKLNYENSSSLRSAVAMQWDGNKGIEYRSANDVSTFNIEGAGELVLDIKKQTIQWVPGIPKPSVPVYSQLKPLYINTTLVDGAPKVSIYAPGVYAQLGKTIQTAIKQITGVTVPVVTSVNIPLQGHLITLGNRSTNPVISKMYDRGFTYLDLKYPGKGGYLVRSLHNPYGNGYNVFFAGGSDLKGVQQATDTLISLLKGKKGSLTAGYMASIKVADGSILPNLVKDAEIWDASMQYNSSGYFGWNSVSKSMALYYMTGEERYRKEFMRLAYPDTQAIKEMEINDGELVENKRDPLSGPYHYGAYMMICLWDLIEESPAFTDEERLKITNSLARQLMHRVAEYGSIYYNQKAPVYVGDRHDDWAAFSLYVLALYFNRDYPSAVWNHCVKAADLHFSTLETTSWTASRNDHLFWFTTFYDPMINYLLFSGKRDATRLANLRKALQTQEVIYTGVKNDWGLKTSSVSLLNKMAYLLNDGRWLYMRQRNGVNTDVFRLGQSYWPGPGLQPKAPVDLTGKWTIHHMQKDMWQTRDGGIPLNQSYRWGSYRSDVDEKGDFVIIKGYNGAGRNPYHSFDVLELRLNGATLLKGYHNQVWTSADGMVEPKVAMDAKLVYQGTLEDMVTTVNEVPDLPFVNWRRTLALRKKQYVIIADELSFETNSENLVAQTTWQTAGATWAKDHLRIRSQEDSTRKNFVIHTSEKMQVDAGTITTMHWKGVAEKGKRKVFFHLLAPDNEALACLQVQDHVAALRLPEAAIVIAGAYKNTQGEFVLIDEHSVYGRQVTAIGLSKAILTADKPVDLFWKDGKLVVEAAQAVIIRVNGRTVKLGAGKSTITSPIPGLSGEIKNIKPSGLVKQAVHTPVATPAAPLREVIKYDIGGSPVESILINDRQLAIATGKTINLLDEKGALIRKLATAGNIRVLRWWNEHKLLLAGCDDERVIAFDEQGNKKWEFISEMDRAVYDAGKQYWFKSAYPGVYGLYSGLFDNNKSRAFVGSACTLEIIDENGQLVKRLPLFWSVIRQFMMIKDAAGNNNLVAGGWQNGTNDLAVFGSKEMAEISRGYNDVPKGHSLVTGWMNMNRFDNFLVDMNGDGKNEIVSAINGAWNRITVYSETGKALYNCQIGPGTTQPRSNIRMTDVGDLDNDGQFEIITGLASGFVNVLDNKTNKKWAKLLPVAPVVVKVIKERGNNWICVGREDGKVIAMDVHGKVIGEAHVNGRPVDIQVMPAAAGPVVVITSATGDLKGFRLPGNSQARVYYFSNKGNDKNNGTSESSPKRSLAAAMALAQEGNTLLFNRGDAWYETLGSFDLRNRKGVTIGAYGHGALPVISNMHLLNAWKYDARLKLWWQEVAGYSKATRLFVNGKSKYRVNTSDSLADEKAVNEPHEWYIKEITPGKKAIIYLAGSVKPQQVEVLPVSMPSVMVMRNTYHVTVKNIDFRGGSPGHVVYVEAPSSHIVFDSCIIQRANGSGIMAENNATGDLKPYVSNISITNCLIDKVWSTEENDPRIKLSGDGIFLRHAVDTGLVKGNTILNWGHSGISITVYALGVHGVHHILVEQNDVSAGVSGYMHGIDMNGFDGATTHNIIRRNYFHDYFVTGHILGSYNQIYSNIFAGIKITSMPRHSHQGWAVDWYPWPFKGTNNWMEAHDNLLINNTFVHAEEVAVMIHDDPKNPDPVRNNVIANNIIYGYGKAGVSVGTNMKGSLFVQHNNFWNGDTTAMHYKNQNYSAASLNDTYPDQCAGNLQTDPAFENVSARNFRLTERTPEALRSGGTNKYHQLLGQGFVDYYGRPWNADHPGMGAIQYEKKQH